MDNIIKMIEYVINMPRYGIVGLIILAIPTKKRA